MPAEFFAILSSMGFAADAILVRQGARNSHVNAAAFLSFSVTVLCLWGYLFFHSPFHAPSSQAALYFVLSGILQPLLSRVLYYVGITRIGVARAGTLRGTSPLFALMLALIFLHERPTILVYAGTLFTVASIWLLSSRDGGPGAWKFIDLLLPLSAAFFSALSQNLRKAGLLIDPDPVPAAAITTSTSLAIFVVFLLATGKISLVKPHKKSLPFFGSAALVSASAQLLNFVALDTGQVSVIVPLLNTSPLFTVLLGSLFLRDLEKINLRVLLGVLLMVAGMAIITSR